MKLPSRELPQDARGLRAVILAGGKGTRLRPFTVNFPKPLVPVGDSPILEVLLRYLLKHGINDVTLTLGHLSELIRAYLLHARNLTKLFHLQFVDEEAPSGTAGSLAEIPNLNDTFLAMNGDVLTDLNLHELVAFHRQHRAALTIAAHERRVKVNFGVLEFDGDNCVTGYHEKPEQIHHVSMGIYVYEPRVLPYIERGKYLDFPDLVLRLINKGEKVCAFPSNCQWFDMGRPDDLTRAQETLARERGDDVVV